MSISVNRSRKTISCKGRFFWPWPERVEFKVLGIYEYWFDLHKQYLAAPSTITFEQLEPHLSRAKGVHVDKLKKYAADDRDSFAWDFYRQFIYLVNYCNPLNPTKKRMNTPHGMNKADFYQLIVDARWLYVLLQYWNDRPRAERPKELRVFCERHGIGLGCGLSPKDLVIDALCSIHVNDELLGDADSFYTNHLLEDLRDIKAVLNTLQGLPTSEPLKTILQK